LPARSAVCRRDAAAAYRRFSDDGGSILESIPAGQRWSLIIDGLFGIGLQRPLAVATENSWGPPMRLPLATAVPCSRSTARAASTPIPASYVVQAIRASHTLTFIAAKPGLLTADGPDHCGSIAVASLDLDAERLATPTARTIGTDLFVDCLRPRARNSHKGSHGSVGILGGASSMVGARSWPAAPR
jgi:hypothetical protein